MIEELDNDWTAILIQQNKTFYHIICNLPTTAGLPLVLLVVEVEVVVLLWHSLVSSKTVCRFSGFLWLRVSSWNRTHPSFTSSDVVPFGQNSSSKVKCGVDDLHRFTCYACDEVRFKKLETRSLRRIKAYSFLKFSEQEIILWPLLLFHFDLNAAYLSNRG